MSLTLTVLFFGGLVYTLANMIHRTVMPLWYVILCYAVVAIALQIPNAWMQFECLSILGVTAMLRDLVKKGIIS